SPPVPNPPRLSTVNRRNDLAVGPDGPSLLRRHELDRAGGSQQAVSRRRSDRRGRSHHRLAVSSRTKRVQAGADPGRRDDQGNDARSDAPVAPLAISTPFQLLHRPVRHPEPPTLSLQKISVVTHRFAPCFSSSRLIPATRGPARSPAGSPELALP